MTGPKLVKLGATCFVIAGVVSIDSAQAGRNSPKPTPSPATNAGLPSEYSESTPSVRPHPVRITPKAGSKKPDRDKARTTSGTLEAAQGIITIETELVTVPVSVFARDGRYVSDLKVSDFKVFEDGVEQSISYFGTTQKPFTVILLLDTSLSTSYKIEEIRRAALAFVDQLSVQDIVSVIEFDGNIHVLTEPTADRTRIYRAIEKADFGYGTSLYDAVYHTLRKKLARITGRKAIVLFTDGVDTTSENAGYDTTLAFAEESDTVIFPIYYDTFSWNTRPGHPVPALASQSGTTFEEYERGRNYLLELADYTGGRVFRPDGTAGGLTEAFRAIAEELQHQYNIGYIPSSKGTTGQRKQIRVRVDRPGLTIRARDSYIVGESRRKANN